jgi:SAM-dependent methyltransferase
VVEPLLSFITGNSMGKPFVDYYLRHGIAPVAQDIRNLERHCQRRASLYRQLGIPLHFAIGRDVLEFGPGTGHNAICILNQNPRRYVLVDANPIALEQVRQNFDIYCKTTSCEISIINTLIEAYEEDNLFDLVLCEGLLSGQLDPKGFLRYPARRVQSGGVLVVTCTDALALLSDFMRVLLVALLSESSDPLPVKIEKSRNVLTQQFAHLKGMSRSVEDWIADNIQVFESHLGEQWLFTVQDAIAVLRDDFVVYGSSPHFFQDQRWYKDIHGQEVDRTNDLFIRAYRRNAPNMINYRLNLSPVDEQEGAALMAMGEMVLNSILAFFSAWRTQTDDGGLRIRVALTELAQRMGSYCVDTQGALEEYADFLARDPEDRSLFNFVKFSRHFGRGMIYLSLIRK